MRIEELSIGDFIFFTDGDCAVNVQEIYSDAQLLVSDGDSISEPVHITHLRPIPLTPEILEKNGFNKFSECGWRNLATKCFLYRYGIKYWDITINGGNRTYRPARIRIENILHTHQLQHALRLAGIEKEIEL